MKRLYITLGLLLTFGISSFAQVADFAAYVDLNDSECVNAGDAFQPDDSLFNTQPFGIWGVINNGPDAIDSNETLWMSTPINVMHDSLLYFSGYTTRYAPAGDPLILLSYLPADSIHTLVDINAIQSDTTGYYIVYMRDRADLVDSQIYGFYVFEAGIGDDGDQVVGGRNPDNVDTIRSNNSKYVPIRWHCNMDNNTSIGQLIEEGARHIQIFPNPAVNNLNFEYGFIRNTNNAIASVVDMSGRILLTKSLGKHTFGTERFNMDISSLPAGNYLLEISTGYMNAVGKFTVLRK